MSTDINTLLNTCLELEGLLCLINRRGDTVPDSVAGLVRSKIDILNRGVESIFTSTSEEEDEKSEESSCAFSNEMPLSVDEQAIAENLEHEEEADADIDLSVSQLESIQESHVKEETAVSDERSVKEEIIQEADPSGASESKVRNDALPIELTLNDKFRFRRELFGNSDLDLTNALKVAETMSSVDEVEDYFYNDLCFDPENEAVKDFMRIVTSRFK